MAADEELQDLLEDVDTLYEDLCADVGTGRQLLRSSIQEMEERLDRLTKRDKDMEANLNELQRQNEALQQEKSVLVRNISCLFKTAQLEIARKDRNIKELREENERMKSAKSLTPASHEKNRWKGQLQGTQQRNTNSNSTERDYRSGSGRYVKHGMVDIAKDEPDVNARVEESGQPGPVREIRVRFDEQRCNDASSADDQPGVQRKHRPYDDRGSHTVNRRDLVQRQRGSEVRRRYADIERKEFYGKDRSRNIEVSDEASRAKSRKVT